MIILRDRSPEDSPLHSEPAPYHYFYGIQFFRTALRLCVSHSYLLFFPSLGCQKTFPWPSFATVREILPPRTLFVNTRNRLFCDFFYFFLQGGETVPAHAAPHTVTSLAQTQTKRHGDSARFAPCASVVSFGISPALSCGIWCVAMSL